MSYNTLIGTDIFISVFILFLNLTATPTSIQKEVKSTTLKSFYVAELELLLKHFMITDFVSSLHMLSTVIVVMFVVLQSRFQIYLFSREAGTTLLQGKLFLCICCCCCCCCDWMLKFADNGLIGQITVPANGMLLPACGLADIL